MEKETHLAPKIRVSLDIQGFREPPSKISQMLRMKPDAAWSKGDVIPEGPMDAYYRGPRPRRRRYSCWSIEASLREYSYNVEDYVRNILRRISSVRSKIKKIRGANVMLSVWIDLYPGISMPAIVLSKHTMGLLSEIGADFDCDLALICEKCDEDVKGAPWATD
jgi:hypothetical protein